jgi:hypothetical protein
MPTRCLPEGAVAPAIRRSDALSPFDHDDITASCAKAGALSAEAAIASKVKTSFTMLTYVFRREIANTVHSFSATIA